MFVALSSRGRRRGRRVFLWAATRAGEGRAWSPLVHGVGFLRGDGAGCLGRKPARPRWDTWRLQNSTLLYGYGCELQLQGIGPGVPSRDADIPGWGILAALLYCFAFVGGSG